MTSLLLSALSLCLSAPASSALLDEAALERAMDAALKAVAEATASRPQTVPVERCWARLPAESPRAAAAADAAKVPVEACVHSLRIKAGEKAASVVVDGALTPWGATARRPFPLEPRVLPGARSFGGTREFTGVMLAEKNAHGDQGAVKLKFRLDEEGRVAPSSVWLTFEVTCPDRTCAVGDEPALSASASSWR